MSQENVDLVLSLFREEDLVEVFREGSAVGAAIGEAFAPHFHPDFECVRHDLPGGGSYFGFEGLQSWYRDWLAPWAEYRTTLGDYIDCGDRVVTLQRSTGRLHDSTRQVTTDLATLWTIHDGKVARWEIYPSHSRALKAVGLEQ